MTSPSIPSSTRDGPSPLAPAAQDQAVGGIFFAKQKGTLTRRPFFISTSEGNLVLLKLANMFLRIELDADLADQFLLRLEEIDMLFLVLEQTVEQFFADEILDVEAILRGLGIKSARSDFGGKIAGDDFLNVLADPQRIENLHVGKAFEEQNAKCQLIRMFHLFNRILTPFLGELFVAPIVENAIMQPILIDGRQFASETAIEIID